MKSIYSLLICIAAFQLSAQDLMVKKGSKTRTLKSEKVINIRGASEAYEYYVYSGNVIENNETEIKYKIRTARFKPRSTGKRIIQDYRDSTYRKEIIINKKEISFLYTERQRRSYRSLVMYEYFQAIQGGLSIIIGIAVKETPFIIAGLVNLIISRTLHVFRKRLKYEISHADFPDNKWKLL